MDFTFLNADSTNETIGIDSSPNPRKKLLIIASGWLGHPLLFHHLSDFPNHDILVLWNYSDLPNNEEELSTIIRSYQELLKKILSRPYTHITWIAWSFGVWITERMALSDPRISYYAVNGTPFPSDKNYGIPPKLITLTAKSAKHLGTKPFMTQSLDIGPDSSLHRQSLCDQINAHYPIDSEPLCLRIHELNRLRDLSSLAYTPTIPWTKAFISPSDKIFPPAAQRAYWNQCPSTKINLLPESTPHFPFDSPEILLKCLSP